MKKNLCGISAVILTLALILCSVADYASACREVRSDVLRLHITANSDSQEDQAVKLKVRDALLNSGAGFFDGAVSAEEAREKLKAHLGEMEETADRVLRENGFSYTSRAYIVNEYFDTREYDGITLPAGEYAALRVALGTGEGQNWWCVMFPPLCLPAVTDEGQEAVAVFSENGARVIKAEKGYKIRFRVVEIAERVIDRIRNK